MNIHMNEVCDCAFWAPSYCNSLFTVDLCFVLQEIFGQGVRLDYRIWASKLKFNNLILWAASVHSLKYVRDWDF